jgi:hypothetical protein
MVAITGLFLGGKSYCGSRVGLAHGVRKHDGCVAIDVIPADMCEVDEDQRGEPRPGGSMCDVGSFEVQP